MVTEEPGSDSTSGTQIQVTTHDFAPADKSARADKLTPAAVRDDERVVNATGWVVNVHGNSQEFRHGVGNANSIVNSVLTAHLW